MVDSDTVVQAEEDDTQEHCKAQHEWKRTTNTALSLAQGVIMLVEFITNIWIFSAAPVIEEFRRV